MQGFADTDRESSYDLGMRTIALMLLAACGTDPAPLHLCNPPFQFGEVMGDRCQDECSAANPALGEPRQCISASYESATGHHQTGCFATFTAYVGGTYQAGCCVPVSTGGGYHDWYFAQ